MTSLRGSDDPRLLELAKPKKAGQVRRTFNQTIQNFCEANKLLRGYSRSEAFLNRDLPERRISSFVTCQRRCYSVRFRDAAIGECANLIEQKLLEVADSGMPHDLHFNVAAVRTIQVFSCVHMCYFRLALLLCISSFFAATSLAQNADATKPKATVATVGGDPIYDEELTPTVQGQLLPLRTQEYEIKKRALDSLIEQKLLEKAAKKNGITTEKLLAQEVDAKAQDPSDAEVEAYYLAQKDRLNRPLDEIKVQLRQSLKQAKLQQARQDYMKSLRMGSEVVVLLTPPKIQVGYDPKRLRGNPKAPVMIVEFSDYQCPYCRQVEPVIKDLLTKYGDKVSLSYRDLPLRQIHPQAQIAAEASRCAEEQGKFWEYHDQLFSSSKLDHDALLDYARTLKLDDKQFDSCLTSEKYKAEIEQDLQDGMHAGITGTPGFFINGVALSGSQPEDSFAKLIDGELARKR